MVNRKVRMGNLRNQVRNLCVKKGASELVTQSTRYIVKSYDDSTCFFPVWLNAI